MRLPDKIGAQAEGMACRVFTKKNIALLLAAVFLLNIALLFTLGKYDRPTGDDYAYSYLTKPVWDQTHAFSALIASAADMSAWVYKIWQGSYSACFLMALQPGIFGETAYSAVPVFLLLSFVLSVSIFFFVCLNKLFFMDGWSITISALTYALVTVNFLPKAAQAFYWYNGGVYYTFFFSLSLLFVSLIVSSIGKSRGTVIKCVLAALLALFIGGGNLATDLNLAVILVLAVVLELILKRRDPVLFVGAAFFAVGFLFNVCAPGNALRMESEGTGRGFIESILYSVLYTVQLYGEWFSVPVLLSGLLLVPVFLPYLKRASERFSFRYPAAVLIFLVLMNAVGYAPLLYSGSNLHIPRLHNIQFYESVLLYDIGLFYLTGWVLRVRRDTPERAARRIQTAAVSVLLLMTAVFLLPSPPFDDGNQAEITAVSAYHSLINRDAYRYARARNARQKALEDPNTDDVMLHPIFDSPELFHFRELHEDPQFMGNRMVAHYFGKNSVVISPNTDAN